MALKFSLKYGETHKDRLRGLRYYHTISKIYVRFQWRRLRISGASSADSPLCLVNYLTLPPPLQPVSCKPTTCKEGLCLILEWRLVMVINWEAPSRDSLLVFSVVSISWAPNDLVTSYNYLHPKRLHTHQNYFCIHFIIISMHFMLVAFLSFLFNHKCEKISYRGPSTWRLQRVLLSVYNLVYLGVVWSELTVYGPASMIQQNAWTSNHVVRSLAQNPDINFIILQYFPCHDQQTSPQKWQTSYPTPYILSRRP